jgi:hypothetical protein
LVLHVLAMSKELELLLLHVVSAGFVYGFCRLLMDKDYAGKLYEDRKLSEMDWLFLPGPLAKKETWIRVHRWIAVLGLIFVSVLYISTMLKIVGRL